MLITEHRDKTKADAKVIAKVTSHPGVKDEMSKRSNRSEQSARGAH